jgi:transcriptional regulator with XRE-family HTH domain
LEPWRKNLTRLIEEQGSPAIQRALGVRGPTVTRWKNGQRWPDPGMVLRICEAFDLTLDELYGVKRGQPAQRPSRLEVPGRPEVLELVERLQEAQEILVPYLREEDLKALHSARELARRSRAKVPRGAKRKTRQGDGG